MKAYNLKEQYGICRTAELELRDLMEYLIETTVDDEVISILHA